MSSKEDRYNHEVFNAMVPELIVYYEKHPNGTPVLGYDALVHRRKESELASWINGINNGLNQSVDYLSPNQFLILQKVGFPFVMTRDARWNSNYHKLYKYKEEKGHCNVARSDVDLGRWSASQREQYKKGTLSPVRQEKLEQLGFKWSVGKTWDEMQNELAAFKQEKGHCDVPKGFKDAENKSTLANWVKEQRKQYKLYGKGERSTLTDTKVNILNGLGFTWDFSTSKGKRSIDKA